MPRESTAILKQRLMKGLRAVAAELVNRAKIRATSRVDTGELRNSITYTEEEDYVLFGLPANEKNKSLELGFKPHYVPGKYIGVWAKRHGFGKPKGASKKRKSKKKKTDTGTGLYVGGPGSFLDYGPGGARSVRYVGKLRVVRLWVTKGSQSEFIARGKVGFSVIQHTVNKELKGIAADAFLKGYRYGR